MIADSLKSACLDGIAFADRVLKISKGNDDKDNPGDNQYKCYTNRAKFYTAILEFCSDDLSELEKENIKTITT
eukprot:UN22948